MSNRLLRGALPALLMAVPSLQAGDLLDNAQFKLRAGYGTGNLRTDLHAERMMGLGFGSAIKMGGGKLTFDLNFDYFPGKNWDAMPRSGTFYYNPASPSSTHNGLPVTLAIIAVGPVAGTATMPATIGVSGSADNRKNWFEGFSLRTGYSQAFAEGWDWQAGLSLDLYKSTEEVSGTLYPIGSVSGTVNGVPTTRQTNIENPASGTPAQPYYEGLAAVGTKTKAGIGFYGGVVNQLTKDVKIEANLRSVSYTKLTYQPFTYTGRPATTDEKSRMGFVFELALGIRF